MPESLRNPIQNKKDKYVGQAANNTIRALQEAIEAIDEHLLYVPDDEVQELVEVQLNLWAHINTYRRKYSKQIEAYNMSPMSSL